MNLLPRSHAEFQLQEYWDRFFSKRSTPFEWYGEYTDLCHVLHKYVKPASKILVVGCGNSKLSEDLYDAGFHGIDNIDISDVVIRQMSARNRQKRPEMTFTKMDMLQMAYSNGMFDCVIDKGTLDAVFSKADDSTVQKVSGMFQEVGRVLKVSGRYLCVTLAQDHILQKLLGHFEYGWLVRVHKVLLGSGVETEGGLGGALPVFVFVMTKMARIEGRAPMKVYEYVEEGERCVRCESVEGLRQFVKDSQQYAMIRHHLASLHIDAPLQMDLWSPDVSSEPRYTLHVVDQPKRKGKKGPFAIFIVPQGREMDWLFASAEGHKQLAESAGFERLVVVILHRGHSYPGVEGVKEEVGGKAAELVQAEATQGGQYPVLTLGDGLGCRTVLCEDSSALSGPFVVEESVGGEGEVVRRLIFLSAPQLAQTEVKMVSAKKQKRSKKKGPVLHPNPSHLSCAHHQAMVASLALTPGLCSLPSPGQGVLRRILVVGLGGGALPAYIHRHISTSAVEVVELDPKMVEVAERWFGFSQGERMKVHIRDGVEFVLQNSSANTGCYHAIVLDVDSKDHSTGMSSPPLSFVKKDFLEAARNMLHDDGIFVTNLAARNKELRETVIKSFKGNFSTLLTIPIPEDVNEVLVGMPQHLDEVTSLSTTTKSSPLRSSGPKLTCNSHLKDSVANLASIIAESSGGSQDTQNVTGTLLEYLENAVLLM